jgi:hypothetical protein
MHIHGAHLQWCPCDQQPVVGAQHTHHLHIMHTPGTVSIMHTPGAVSIIAVLLFILFDDEVKFYLLNQYNVEVIHNVCNQ